MKSSGPSELGVVMRPGHMIRRPTRPSATRTDKPSSTKAVSTRIFVKSLMVEAECGVYAHEKGRRRPLVVDLEVEIDPAVRVGSDALAETVDYDALVAHVRAVASGEHLHLIETFAEKVCEAVLGDARIVKVKLRVEKPGAVPGAACSGVELERTR
ncbi:dihydroneopterin aldolase [Candidatus Phycosocius bacilliformis]|uniref:7,8-dihydroneopterin aldolase n=1 Tax=Candidatus Phycosocius bacilliformis TaxID=1445552 RepID=A0A2P2EAK1_9PROT|nr:dihydroneopterin aldolase [Candidatus Phycosocius bacilliformis]GBF58084.1 dihydroneopterin aldolase [Candidatus Phycosocius bacilliformis]